MSGRSEHKKNADKKLYVIVVVVLILNTLVIALGIAYMLDRMSGSETRLIQKQEFARELADYNHRLAIDAGVFDLPVVREALAEYKYEVDLASSSDEIMQIIFTLGRNVQEVILNEAEARLKEQVIIAVNQDRGVQQTEGRLHLFIRVSEGRINIVPDRFLEPYTVHWIENIFTPYHYHGSHSIDLEIVDGIAGLAVPETTEDQLQALNEDLNTMRALINDLRSRAGLAEMVGPGITLAIYDAEEHHGSGALVHDADIRDVVNELFSAGARGISVGGQRLTTTSPIRCSGPLIMVNYQQITTNPVIIHAVGNPELMISGLSIIRTELQSTRGISFDISHSGFIKLPPYDGGSQRE